MAWTEQEISNTKICNRCNCDKNVCEFDKDVTKPDGRRTICKKCRKAGTKGYYENNKAIIIEKTKSYYEKNIHKIKEYKRQYQIINNKKLSEQDRENRIRNPEIFKERARKYKEGNLDRIKERRRVYWQKNSHKLNQEARERRRLNPEKYKEKDREKYQKNKQKVYEQTKKYRQKNKKRRNERERNRKKTDPMFKMIINLRLRTVKVFKRIGSGKPASTQEMLGCSWEMAKTHIEEQFSEGMIWGNHGDWHIDHKKPLALAKTPEELVKLVHYTNLQPLWKLDNLRKGIKI